jgi:P27 family predicted phage terminase small subunit
MPSGGPRTKKPTKLKVIQGTFRKDRAPANEPKPRPIAPSMPADLSGRARTLWKRLKSKLEKLELLTELDGPMFTTMCEAWARWYDARARLRGVLRSQTKVKDLALIRKAELSVERAEHSFRLLANEFGLSPAARARLDVDVGKEVDDLDEFLDGQAT